MLNSVRLSSLSMEFPRREYWCGLPFPPPRESSQPGDWTRISCVSCIGRQILHHYATWKDLWVPLIFKMVLSSLSTRWCLMGEEVKRGTGGIAKADLRLTINCIQFSNLIIVSRWLWVFIWFCTWLFWRIFKFFYSPTRQFMNSHFNFNSTSSQGELQG